jgi:hypothetical protein
MLYVSTSGRLWNEGKNWMEGDVCPSGDWYGVECSGSDVSSVSLYGNRLVGSLPSQLGLLVKLTNFDLSWNDLCGEIPSQVAALSKPTITYAVSTVNPNIGTPCSTPSRAIAPTLSLAPTLLSTTGIQLALYIAHFPTLPLL